MKGLDLSKFSKVGESDKHFTFKHKDGHWIKVSKGGLTTKYCNDLSKLPMALGGAVEGVNPPTEVKGGKSLAGEHLEKGDKKAAKEEHEQVLREMKSDKTDRKYMADGGDTTRPTPTPTPEPTPPPPSPISKEQADIFKKSFDSASGVYADGTPDAPVGQEPPDTTPETNPTQGEPPQAPATGAEQGVKPWLDQENNAYENDLALGHVKPETYGSLFAKKDTLGKIGTLFGLVVGGAGSGLTHQPNAALQMMDKTIERDLDAQKASASNRQNFYNLNMQNPLVQAQAQKTGVDASTLAYTLGQSQALQSSFHDLVSKLNKMPAGPQKEAYRQQLLATYGPMRERINNLNDSAAVFGQPQEEQQAPTIQPQQGQVPEGLTNLRPILHPGASSMVKGMQFNPVAEKDYPALMEQYTGAQQAEKGLQALPQAFNNMANNTTVLNHLTHGIGNALDTVPYVGGAASSALNAVSGYEDKSEKYNSAKTTMLDILANSLKHTNVSSGQIQKVVDDNQPERLDSPEIKKQKLEAIAGFVRRAQETSLLQKHGLLGKQLYDSFCTVNK